MNRLYGILLICVLSTGCAALMTEQTYLRVNAPVTEKFIFSGVVYSIPEPKEIRKIIILGEGKVQNIDIYARDGEFNWKEIKKIKDTVTFPLEITMVANTDAVRILQKSVTGKGQIHTVEFYTITSENQ
ncbi:hypothetical protein C6503_04785 [Candidatus Poribacteria bacterium]|nr:MAG: hypothetical protein C6503_04785 [Candidatus Poribacteria bacterium]